MAAVEVPVGHVVPRMVDDANVGVETRDEVDPFLVDEESFLDADDAPVEHSALPPCQKLVDRVASGLAR